MRARCPHCHYPVEIADDDLKDLTCNSCGSHFGLIGDDATATFAHQERTIGHFELVHHVGTGAFGSVWKARDKELDRTVAIKIPRRDQLTASEADAFLREARAAAQLRHPQIVGVHEIGRDGDTVYIVSDFVDGANLKEWLSSQRLSAREAAELVAKIAGALEHAHRSGVVHRDLKPGNIMLDLDGQPHITDFGLAKRQSGELSITLEGTPLGTPNYMPPEQARGEGHHADARSDIYSMGVILFELLTGEVPFRGEAQMVLVQIQKDEPPRLRKLNARIPRDLETIALECLEKDPAKRYQTAQDLADDLHRWLKGEPIVARPIGRAARGWRWCKRQPVVAGLVAATALLLIVGTTVSSYFAVRANRFANDAEAQTQEVAKERDRATANYQRARKAVDELFIAVSQNQLANTPGTQPLRKELLQTASKYYEAFASEYGDDVGLQAELGATYERMGNIKHTLGEHEEAEVAFRRALEIYEELVRDNPSVGNYQSSLATIHNNLAVLLSDSGRMSESEAAYRRAIGIDEKLVRDNPSVDDYQISLSRSYNNLASVQRNTGRAVEAEDMYNRAIEMQERLVRDHPSEHLYQGVLAFTYNNLAALQSYTHRVPESEATYHKAIEINEKLALDNPSVAEYQTGLADNYYNLGILKYVAERKAEAETAYRSTIEIYEKLVRDNPSVPDYKAKLSSAYNNLANVLRDTGRSAEAESMYDLAIEMSEKVVNENPYVPDYQCALANHYNNRANIQRNAGQYAEAEKLYRRVFEIQEKLVRDNPSVIEFTNQLAHSYKDVAILRALNRQWRDSAELYRKATNVLPHDFFLMWEQAAMELVAGDEAAYRAICTELLEGLGETKDPFVRFALVVVCVLGEHALDDINKVLLLAQQAAAAEPANPVYAAGVGVALYRAGQPEAAITALKKSLPAHAFAALAAPEQAAAIQISRLVGETILARAYYDTGDSDALKQQIATVQTLLVQLEKSPPKPGRTLAPWAVPLVSELVRRDLVKIERPLATAP